MNSESRKAGIATYNYSLITKVRLTESEFTKYASSYIRVAYEAYRYHVLLRIESSRYVQNQAHPMPALLNVSFAMEN